MTRRLVGIMLAWLLAGLAASSAQELPPCGQRAGLVELPRAEPSLWCLEAVVSDDHELAFSALATDPQGTLYATHAARGWVRALRDTDGDGRPDSPEIVLDELRRPHALQWYAGGLYILGDGVLYRWQEDTLTTLINDLPAGRGFLMHGLEIHDDAIYIGIPVPCDDCSPQEPLHGTVIRTTLAGEDRQIIARGLRYPAAIAYYNDALWIGDSAREGLRSKFFVPQDELNRISGAAIAAILAGDDDRIPHFGFPYCTGSSNTRDEDIPGDFDCGTATAPEYVFETGSTPIDLEPYTARLFPHIAGELIVSLGGSADSAQIRGHQILSLEMWHSDYTIFESIMPADSAITAYDRTRYSSESGYYGTLSDLVNRRYAGPWPHHPLDVTISPEGWLYFSLGGTIYTLRPGDKNPCDFTVCRDDSRDEN